MKVLIVEQEKTLQQSLSYFLGRYSRCEVFLAHSKREGLSLSQTILFDTVLCGDRLPDGEGFELLQELMRKDPGMVPVLMSVRSDETLRERAMKAGVRSYLVKPFDLKQLEEAVGLKPCPHLTTKEGGEIK